MTNNKIPWFVVLLLVTGLVVLVGFARFYLMILCKYCCNRRTDPQFYEPNITSDDQQMNARRNQVDLRPTILNGLPTASVQYQRRTMMSDMRQLQVNLHPYEVSIVNSVTPSDPPPRLDQEDLPPSYEEAVKIIFSKS